MNIRERLRRLDGPRQAMLLALVWFLLAALLWVWWDERTLPDVRGRWASVGCEVVRSKDGVSRLKRDLRLDDADWRLTIRFYGDDGCTNGLFSVESAGTYDMGPKAMSPRDATQIRFDLRTLKLAPLTEEAAMRFEAGGCGDGPWKVGEGQEVATKGCLGLVPTLEACPTEYDIVKTDGETLRLGDRSAGLCAPDLYPETFSASFLRRMEDL